MLLMQRDEIIQKINQMLIEEFEIDENQIMTRLVSKKILISIALILLIW